MRLRCVSTALGLAAFAASCIPDVVPNVLTLPRCDEVEAGCGPDNKEDCCASEQLQGGQYDRTNDQAYHATISDLELDRFEATVGRFRPFVEGYPMNKPARGKGAHPRITGSGWDEAWNANLPEDQAALKASLQCDANYRTWTDAPGPNERLPINCVSWYVAFAFCAWDEGRLPTEAEWNYAAAGGNEQRIYPWGNDGLDTTRAAFGCTGAMTCVIPTIGSRSPGGDGKWHQADMAGSMAEWTLDFHGPFVNPCNDCAALTDLGSGREVRGGDFAHDTSVLATTSRLGLAPEERQDFVGIRCARDR